MKPLAVVAFAISLLLTLSYNFACIPGCEKINIKKQLIKKKLEEKYQTSAYIIISEKRYSWFNRLLPLASNDSFHLKGMAVDFWLMDLNNDGEWDNNDIVLMVKIIKEVESEYPELTGGTGTYLNSGFPGSRMVHTDVRGIAKHWR